MLCKFPIWVQSAHVPPGSQGTLTLNLRISAPPAVQLAQVRVLLEAAAAMADAPTLVAGDFNSAPASGVHRFCSRLSGFRARAALLRSDPGARRRRWQARALMTPTAAARADRADVRMFGATS